MRRRTRSREIALQLLYMHDLRSDAGEHMKTFLEEETKDRQVREFSLRLVEGVKTHRDEIDALLKHVAKNWEIHRMATIDRNVLRMAIFEILHCDDIPANVSINEAIELGKRFSTQNSGAFINGILDRVSKDSDITRVSTAPRVPAVSATLAPSAAEAPAAVAAQPLSTTPAPTATPTPAPATAGS
jgi:N utilization substance protein B